MGSNFFRIYFQERNSLLEEIMRQQGDVGDMTSDFQVMEAERVRLVLLEEKIKEVLGMLRSLNAMVRMTSFPKYY